MTLHATAWVIGFALLVAGGLWRGMSFVVPFLGCYLVCYFVVRWMCETQSRTPSPEDLDDNWGSV